MLLFLQEFHNRQIDSIELDKFKGRFKEDLKYRNKVTEFIMVYNESFVDVEKSKMFARLFGAHISGHFDWRHFRHLSSCLHDLKYEGISFLTKLSTENFEVPEDRPKGAPERDFDKEAVLSAAGIAFTAGAWSSGFYVTDAGKDLYRHGVVE